MADERIEVWYYIGKERHASRDCFHVPREGDEIRLKTGLYRIGRVVWIEDERFSRVAIALEPIKESQ